MDYRLHDRWGVSGEKREMALAGHEMFTVEFGLDLILDGIERVQASV